MIPTILNMEVLAHVPPAPLRATTKAIQTKLHITLPATHYHLDKLERMGYVKRHGVRPTEEGFRWTRIHKPT